MLVGQSQTELAAQWLEASTLTRGGCGFDSRLDYAKDFKNLLSTNERDITAAHCCHRGAVQLDQCGHVGL